MESTPTPRVAKICVIGDSGVGKTCLRSRYLNGSFQLGYKATIGADFLSRVVEFDIGDGNGKKEKMSVSIWDTAGQERFRSLGSSFYRGSDAVILVYSTTSSNSLNSLPSWFKEFRARCPVIERPFVHDESEAGAEEEEDFPWLCVGTKIDLKQERQVKKEEVESLLEGLVPRIDGFSTAESTGYSVGVDPEETAPVKRQGPTPHSCQPTSKYPTSSRTSIDLVPPPDPNSTSRTQRLRKRKDSESPSTGSTLRTTNTQSIYHTPQSSFYSLGSHASQQSTLTLPDHSRNSSASKSSSKTSLNSRQSTSTLNANATNEPDSDLLGPSATDLRPSSSHTDSDFSDDDLSPNSSAYYTHQYEEEVELERSRESTFAKSRGIDVWMSSSPPRAPESLRQKEKSRWRDPIEGLLGSAKADGDIGGEEVEVIGANILNGKTNGLDEEEVDEEEHNHKNGITVSYKRDGIKHFETSSKTGEGVDGLFEYLFRRIRAKWAEEEERDERERAERERRQAGKIDLGAKIGKKTWKEACCT